MRPGLVLVAALPPQCGQVLPHETSFESQLTLACSHTIRLVWFSTMLFSHTSRTCPGCVGVPGIFLELCSHRWSRFSFLERSRDHDHSSCRRRCAAAGYSSQDLA